MIQDTLNAEMVEKCIARLVGYGRKVDVEQARRFGASLVAEGFGCDSASETADCFVSFIWNAGYVR